MDFFNVLTGPELLELTEAQLPEHRERLYPPTVTLAMFLRQALSPDGSCQRAVDGWAASRAAEGLAAQSIRTGGYCRARGRLPLGMVQALTRESGRLLSERARSEWRWRGRTVKLLDGTGISMPDTAENQAVFPQPAFQAGDVLLADALYANYFMVAELMAAGVDVVLEQHGSRRTDFRRGERLGSRDHLVCWP